MTTGWGSDVTAGLAPLEALLVIATLVLIVAALYARYAWRYEFDDGPRPPHYLSVSVAFWLVVSLGLTAMYAVTSPPFADLVSLFLTLSALSLVGVGIEVVRTYVRRKYRR